MTTYTPSNYASLFPRSPASHSLLYASPELLRHGARGKASDVYAFGVLLWELATGLPLPEALASCPALQAWLLHQPLVPPAAPPELSQPGDGAAMRNGAEQGATRGGGAGGCRDAEALAVPPELLCWRADVPAGLRQLVTECLRERPAERPTFEQLCVRLEQLLWPEGPGVEGGGPREELKGEPRLHVQ